MEKLFFLSQEKNIHIMRNHHYREILFLKKGERMRDFVFGYHDGAVTTFAVIVALTVAGLDHSIVLLGALTNIFGAGIAFTLGDYASIKTQIRSIKSFSYSRKLSSHERDEMKDLAEQFDKPYKIALITFTAFVTAGAIALAPFIFVKSINALDVSTVLVLMSVFFIGVMRAKYTHGDRLRSGLEMVLIASIALGAAYFIGVYGLELLVR